MSNEWRSLDNAAKIFPSAKSGADTQVFRFSCDLYENIDQVILQQAVCEALDIFDLFRVVIKRGIFWYYLEKTDIKPIVRKEYKAPCSSIYKGNKDNLLFEVTFYRNRINLEIYHVLSDGTGAMNFLNTIVAIYLKLRHNLQDDMPEYDASKVQMKDDSFGRYYIEDKTHREKTNTAYKIRGNVLPEDRINLIVAHMNVSEVLNAAHTYDATITEFIGACLIDAICSSMTNRAKKKDVVLSIPVNLRKYFPSESASNFFGLIFTGINFYKKRISFEDIIDKINKDFTDKLNQEKLLEKINLYSAIEHNFFIKIIPLGIKDFFLSKAYKISMKQSTATLSNIGRINMPGALQRYIKSYDVYAATNKLQACMCSYNNILSISFTTPFVDKEIQRLFFRKLASFDIKCYLSTNVEGGSENERM